jgi:hypothetical protein
MTGYLGNSRDVASSLRVGRRAEASIGFGLGRSDYTVANKSFSAETIRVCDEMIGSHGLATTDAMRIR